MFLSKADFEAIRRKIENRKTPRLEKRKSLFWSRKSTKNDFMAGLAGNPRPSARKTRRRVLGHPRPLGAKSQIKAIKMRLLPRMGGGLWSRAVRKRDRNRCVMCGKAEGLQAHHWLFRRSHSLALSVDICGGVTLCYGCHIGRIHRDGDGDFMLRLAAKMQAIMGDGEIDRMRTVALNPQPLGLDWWREAEIGLKYYLEKP